METIENIFSDHKGNHLLVALDFYDFNYKRDILSIPEEFCDIDIVDINIGKAFVDKPIHYSVFITMSTWLMNEFEKNPNAIFSYICSTDELPTNHSDLKPYIYRWTLFNQLFKRIKNKIDVNILDVIVGEDEYQSFARAFYRDRQAPILHLISSHLQNKHH